MSPKVCVSFYCMQAAFAQVKIARLHYVVHSDCVSMSITLLASNHLLGLQVEVIPQRWQLGFVHGLVRYRISVQHTSPSVWLFVGAAVLVVHGSHPLGCILGDGHSWICIFFLVHLQDLRICEGRLVSIVWAPMDT